ncbi:hypothetical protein Tco_0589889 [Tanacetum coccineum]
MLHHHTLQELLTLSSCLKRRVALKRRLGELLNGEVKQQASYNLQRPVTSQIEEKNETDHADQLRLQLERENLHGVNAKTCLQALRTQFKEFLASKGVNATDLLNQGWQQDFEYFTAAVKPSVNALKENGSQLHDEILHKHQIKSSVKTQSQDIQIKPVQAMDDSLIVSKGSLIEPENNDAFSKSEIETHMQRQEEKVDMREAVDAGLVVTESSGTKPDKQNTSSSSGTTEQSEPSYDTHLLETIESNTTPTSTNMCHRGGEIDQDALLKTELLKTKDMLEPNAFTSERPRISRPRFASQVDEKNDLSKTVTPHYLPKVRESAAAKPHQVNAPNYSRNSHKESYGSNDMVWLLLEDARKMTQDKTRIPSHKDMASTRAHCTPNACTPKPRNIYRSSPVSKCSGGMSNGEPLIRWQKRIFLHLNLQDEMNRSFIAQNSYRLERETFSKIYRSCRRILSSTFQLIFQEHKLALKITPLHDNFVPKPYLALELGKSISLTEAEEEAVAREVHATHAKGTINMGLWYPKDSGFELTAFSDADHAGCLDTRKSTSGGIQFLGDKLV